MQKHIQSKRVENSKAVENNPMLIDRSRSSSHEIAFTYSGGWNRKFVFQESRFRYPKSGLRVAITKYQRSQFKLICGSNSDSFGYTTVDEVEDGNNSQIWWRLLSGILSIPTALNLQQSII
jgi:hypothetical protein